MSNERIAPRPKRQVFAALRYRNFRLWFVGQIVSLFGVWMQNTAQGYFVYELTGSPVYLGYVGFASGISVWIFTLYGGVIADRIPRRTLLVITQSSMMILALALSAMTFLNVVQPWHVVAFAFLLGTANAFDAPARQAFVLEMVDRKDLTNAIALNSMMFNTATAIGPAAGGVIYALFGPAWCFAINGITYIAVIGALLLMKIEKRANPPKRAGTVAAMGEAFRYVRTQPVILGVMAIILSLALFGMSFMTIFPVWAVKVIGGDSTTNGLLQSARGIGAFSGALIIAAIGSVTYKGKLFTAGTFAFPALLLLFALTRTLPTAFLVLPFAGIAQMFVMNLGNAQVQTMVDDGLRGRVMGLYTLVFFGFIPIGSLIAGTLAAAIGAPLAVAIMALGCIAAAVAVWIKVPTLRAQ